MKKLTKNRCRMIVRQPFFAHLMMRLNTQITSSVPTMATNGVDLLVNEKFVESLTDEEVQGVLCHEVMHVALLHPFRKGSREHKLWNVACDYVINGQLDDLKIALPKGALINHKFDGMGAEEVYEQLKQEGFKTPSSYIQDIIEGFNKLSKDEQDRIISDVKQSVVAAAQACQKKGQLPAGMERLVANVINPPIPWADELRQYCVDFAKDDYSWAHPNRRYGHTGFVMPSLHSHAMGEIVVGVDTSGSIDEKLLATFIGCIDDIVIQNKPKKITTICCDASIQSVQEFSGFDKIDLKLKGGGGTSFIPVFDYIEKEGIEPSVLIYLTDTYGDFPKEEPSYPVVWVTFGGDTVPFGRTIKVNV